MKDPVFEVRSEPDLVHTEPVITYAEGGTPPEKGGKVEPKKKLVAEMRGEHRQALSERMTKVKALLTAPTRAPVEAEQVKTVIKRLEKLERLKDAAHLVYLAWNTANDVNDKKLAHRMKEMEEHYRRIVEHD